jgi:predicted ATP-grasp superfamily ATP-dependent carboligase
MRVLVTGSRMPFALGIVRKLADAGHEVWAADDYELAPGSHSRYLAGHFVTASPRQETERFIDDLERIVHDQGIDVLVPAFEEVFYIATQHERLARHTSLFASPFATLAPLHDKASFQRLVTRLGLPTPPTVVATSDAELAAAIERFPRYFARAAFSRGGVSLLTNTGPLAGALAPEDCHPTTDSPWLVQEFVDGPTLCTYSTARDGSVTGHCMYRIPRQWKHSTGIQFESIDGTESLALIEPIVAEVGYTGQISFDFVDTTDGLTLIECNPRATDGALLVSSEELADGVLGGATGADAEPFMVAPGEQVQLDLAVLGEGFSDHLRHLPGTIADLARVHDAGDGWHDPLPTMYSALAVAHNETTSLREHEQLFVAMAGDISWDGEPIAGMSAADASLLERLSETSP